MAFKLTLIPAVISLSCHAGMEGRSSTPWGPSSVLLVLVKRLTASLNKTKVSTLVIK